MLQPRFVEPPAVPQIIERGNTISPALIPRLAGDGEETDVTSSDQSPNSSESDNFGGQPRLSARPPAFLDSQNRYSTDVALRERQRQKDVTFGTTSRGTPLLSGSEETLTLSGGGGYPSANALYVDELSHLQEWKDTVARQSKELDKLTTMLAKVEKERSCLQDEKMRSEQDLALQTQVNKDLKKLLVASMGADLHEQLESASRERAELAQDLENTVSTLVKERETLERVNIQCDVWRSKFLGSRLQVDEVVSSRTRLDMLVQEAFVAMKKLVDERGEMRNHMMTCNRKLQYLANALQRSHSLTEENQASSNVITLALLNEQLASTISQQLLGNVAKDIHKSTGASGFAFIEWTSGEMLAKDLILNKEPSHKVEQLQKPPPTAPTNTSQQHHKVHRYHPTTNYENLTINCCNYCVGDLLVL